jgi:hypothetical protein
VGDCPTINCLIRAFPPHVTESAFGDPTKAADLYLKSGTSFANPTIWVSGLYAPRTDTLSFGADSSAGDGTGVEIGSGALWGYSPPLILTVGAEYTLWAVNMDSFAAPMFSDGATHFAFEADAAHGIPIPSGYTIVDITGPGGNVFPGGILNIGGFRVVPVDDPTFVCGEAPAEVDWASGHVEWA